jgi:hypothetical protein
MFFENIFLFAKEYVFESFSNELIKPPPPNRSISKSVLVLIFIQLRRCNKTIGAPVCDAS